jgi:hypothetical protein
MTGGLPLTAKSEKKSQEKRTAMLSKKQLAMLLAIMILVVSTVSVLSYSRLQSQPPSFSFNAGIIDQLGEEIPNTAFVNDATNILESHGFNVTYHGGTLGVDFFKKLADDNYGIIILRAHSALRDDNSTVDLFTSEPWGDGSAHLQEQQDELVVKGILNYSVAQTSEYYAITSKFIDKLEGTFPRSVIIAMGCNTLVPGLEQLGGAFLDKGAKTYVGWDGYVGNGDTDNATIELLKRLLVYNETFSESVNSLFDSTYGSKMSYYPESARDLRVSDMAASVSTTFQLQTVLSARLKTKIDLVDDRRKCVKSDLRQIDLPVA